MKGGDRLFDHARPMGEIMGEIIRTLKEYEEFRRDNPDYANMKRDFYALKEHMKALEESALLGWPSE